MLKIPTRDLLGRPLNDVEERFAPAHFYVQGEVDLLSPSIVRVSLVGSRKASEEALRRARRLARVLTAEGVVVVSGLARGVDTAAHLSAMENGGRTVAVIGTGLDCSYPRENADLQARIARDHLVVSQFPPGTPPSRRNFPQRNRAMALFADATVIVEAGESSGSLSQGWEALRLARPLFLLASVFQSGLEWPDKMVDYGARELSEADALLDLIPSPTPEPRLAF